LGIRGNISRSNLADTNESRDWRIHCDFARRMSCTRPAASSSRAQSRISNASASTPVLSITPRGSSATSSRVDRVLFPTRLSRAVAKKPLHKSRWQLELFFKWINQHLRIKRFFGTSENAVESQIWIAVATYVLVTIVRKTLNIDLSLHVMLKNLSCLWTWHRWKKLGPHGNQLILL